MAFCFPDFMGVDFSDVCLPVPQEPTPKPRIHSTGLQELPPVQVELWTGFTLPDADELAWMHDCGISHLWYNVNRAGVAGRFVPQWDRSQLAEAMCEAREVGFTTGPMIWSYRTEAFSETAARFVEDLILETDATHLMHNTEREWSLGRLKGREGVQGAVDRTWRPYFGGGRFAGVEQVASPLYWEEDDWDALLDELEILRAYVQTYGQWITGKNHKGTQGPGYQNGPLQEAGLYNYLDNVLRGDIEEVVLGLGAWWQDRPYRSDVYRAMLIAAATARGLGLRRICYWGAHTLQGKRWRQAPRHRAALEQLTRWLTNRTELARDLSDPPPLTLVSE